MLETCHVSMNPILRYTQSHVIYTRESRVTTISDLEIAQCTRLRYPTKHRFPGIRQKLARIRETWIAVSDS